MNTKTTVISQEQLTNQFSCCDKIAAYWQNEGIVPTAYVETYGCQQNEADSEKLRGYLVQSGYSIVQEAEGADVVIMNTCAIREHAEQRVFGNLGALTHTKRRHPGQKIFLCGCMAGETKVSDRIKKSYPHVDGVFSTHHLWQVPEILWNVLNKKKRQFFIEDEPGSIAEGIPQVRDSKLKAWISIMYGCNNFCTTASFPTSAAGSAAACRRTFWLSAVQSSKQAPRRSPCWVRTSTLTARTWAAAWILRTCWMPSPRFPVIF